jgi:hypothetical protein
MNVPDADPELEGRRRLGGGLHQAQIAQDADATSGISAPSPLDALTGNDTDPS